ncbi:MAG: 16S rRNA (cytosine(967)-C(5))-methyltransferase RsmB [Oscillospiraceae bacterium]|nr:16S rRNA (cytosine(967)-C(5))-methyltransferase RsmB [Oscillospiraceae bacterium]
MNARKTALDALIACRKRAAWSNGVLKDYIERDRLDRRDAALATRLCYGILQHRGMLDFFLAQLLTGKVKDLHPVVRDILHMGLYQIYELDKVPDSAAVNESVLLAKKYCRWQRSASGLVNAVLRNAVRTKGTLKQPTALADRYSHPQELIDLLEGYVGKENLEPMLAANNDTPLTVVQVNTLRISTPQLVEALAREKVVALPHPWMADCLVLSNTGNLEKLQCFNDGLFYVQDAASRLAVMCAGITESENLRVLDCCAAPGGKTFAAAILMGGKGKIRSADIHRHKTTLIQHGADRLGLHNVLVREQDATENHPTWHEKMDVVLADVPCSGYGIIRKKPDIRYKDPKEMERLPDLQLKILCKQAKYVKPGGVLMYSTCTLVRNENEGVVEAFLRHHPQFQLEPLPLPGNFPANESGMLALVPGQYDTDGFFIAKMRRKA